MKQIILLGIFIIVPALSVLADKIDSMYTDLSDSKCKTLEANPEEGGSYRGECPGVGGYKIELLEGDLRQSINLIYPNGKKWELDFWKLFSGFSAVGQKAEWLIVRKEKKILPLSLIVRLNVNENPENSQKSTSYLLVTKISPEIACVTDIVKPIKDQNQKARNLANISAKKPCLNPQN